MKVEFSVTTVIQTIIFNYFINHFNAEHINTNKEVIISSVVF